MTPYGPSKKLYNHHKNPVNRSGNLLGNLGLEWNFSIVLLLRKIEHATDGCIIVGPPYKNGKGEWRAW